jgi:rubrerythrin
MIGVISGDIIKSQKIPKQQYDAMLYQLEQSLRAICNKTTRWNIYRGDAFQLQISQSEQLFKTAILIYLHLKSAGYELRQSMALGQVDNPRNDIKTATGSAFLLSGQGLDKITNQRFVFNIAEQNVEDGFSLNIAFVDTLLNKITQKQANALFVYLTQTDNNHAALAKELKTSRENVTKLLNLANYQLIERFLSHAQQTIHNITTGGK